MRIKHLTADQLETEADRWQAILVQTVYDLNQAKIEVKRENERLEAAQTDGAGTDAVVKEQTEQKEETLDHVYQVFPRLKEREKQLARTLSGGEHQMLAIGRALMSKPKLCLFDEPSYGLAPLMVKEIFRIIGELRSQGITVLLVEQNVRHSLEIADRAYVLENGRICLQGECGELLQSETVRQAYMGL
jgi:branched-chain amino acid transport system ATP-binding protein